MRRVAVAVVLAGMLVGAQARADGYHYQPGLHPDPFRGPEAPAPVNDTQLDPLELKVTAIVTGRSIPLAMVETQQGEALILKPGDFVGRNRVEAIRSDRVVFIEVRVSPSGPVKVTRELKI